MTMSTENTKPPTDPTAAGPLHPDRSAAVIVAEGYYRMKSENERLRGIIARNAMQRLKSDDSTEMDVTPDDIKESLEILYKWQRTETPNTQAHPPADNLKGPNETRA
jgi:hypothetical protein